MAEQLELGLAQRARLTAQSIGFSVLGGLGLAGTIETIERVPMVGIVMAAGPALFTLISTIVAVDAWDRAFGPSEHAENRY